MKAMIFAAGLGTRLKPLTDTMPKALVPVGGEPLLAHIIRKLKAYGYDEIVINVHHFAPMIVDFVGSRNNFGIKIDISDESGFLRETGGGILYAAPLLSGESFLVHNVDILSNIDLGKLQDAFDKDEAIATLAVSDRPTSRYLMFDKDMRLVGWTNVKTGEVRSPYGEVDPEKFTKLAFSGIHVASSRILPLLKDFSEAHGEKFSIIDFYLSIAAKETVRAFVPENFRMMDVGKTSSLSEAESFLLSI